MSILIFFAILFILVIVHEAGHFFTAKKFGIRVDEFGFGFPPKLWSRKKGETEYSLNALPFGGFVKIFGETPDEENTSGPDSGRSFINKPKWQQAVVLFAGVFANFILAWLFFSIGLMSGMPASVGSDNSRELEDVNLVIISVMPDSPALEGGLQSGDKIISIKSFSLEEGKYDSLQDINPESLKSFILANPKEEIEIGYLRGKSAVPVQTTVIPEENNEGTPAIGIAMDQIGIAKMSPIPALIGGLRLDWQLTKATAAGLIAFITESIMGRGSLEAVTGPVGLVGIVGDAYEFGFIYLLSFAALISVNLAIINLVPFPALDGGRLLFLLIEKIKGSRINPKVANAANMLGFALLIIFMLVITWNDVAKLL